MHVRKLRLHNFALYADEELEFPKHGIVLVTGPNGSGKSSIAEAVSYAGWGKFLRGEHLFSEGSTATVHMETAHPLTIQRTRTPSRAAVTFSFDGKESSSTTPTKAQPGLDQILGAWDVWRKVHVLTADGAANFTMSTDSERKRMLEILLGLDALDAAHERCRKDVHSAEAHAQSVQSKIETLWLQKGMLTREIESLRGTQQDLPPELTPPAIYETLPASSVHTVQLACAQELRSAEDRCTKAKTHFVMCETTVAFAKAALEAAESGAPCPTCNRPTQPQATAEHLVLALSEAHRRCALEDAVVRDAERTVAAARSAYLEASALLETLTSCSDLLARRATERQKISDREACTRARIADRIAELDDIETQLMELSVSSAEQALSLKEVSAKVLSLTGVRAQMLTDSLAALQASANRWLARIEPEMVVELLPYAERASGGVRDAISIVLHGVGGGNCKKYAGASRGQQRRIDVALVLAMADLAAASAMRDPGTLFFDEVFDGLDLAGTEAVVGVLQELSETRCVLVLSHNQALASRLGAAHHWRVDAGKVSR